MKTEQLADEILEDCVAGRTLQIARIVSAHFERALAPAGITPHQLTLLSMLAKMGGASPRDMLPFLNMEQSTLSRNLDRMVEKGLLNCEANPDDGRMKRYTVSGKGITAIKSAHPYWREAQAWARDAMGEDGKAELKSLAHRLNPLLPAGENPGK